MELSSADRLIRNEVIRDFQRQLSERSAFESRHGNRVAVYAVAIGAELGLAGVELLCVRYAAELHDVGKLKFPQDLFQVRSLVSGDAEVVRLHPQAGAELLSEFEWLSPSVPMIRSHHERWNGDGYPDGVSGEDIPLGARIIGLAEAFDAMTMESGWRAPVEERDALREMSDCAGTQFDPAVVQAFLRVQPVVQPVGL